MINETQFHILSNQLERIAIGLERLTEDPDSKVGNWRGALGALEAKFDMLNGEFQSIGNTLMSLMNNAQTLGAAINMDLMSLEKEIKELRESLETI